jgi:two-component system, cell cycle response regulator DivK
VLILIVDDHADSGLLMAEFFEYHGFRTARAENGEQAIRQALADPPDLILLDLEMPVMSGEGFRQRQLQEPSIATVPVLCISGRYDARDRADRLGLTCFVKPVPLDLLLAEVQRRHPAPTDVTGDLCT